jgi:NTP pyrophosphatase (non-canonical NTP hydrolase)
MNITDLQKRLREFRDERHWQRYHTPQNLAQALSVEAAELLECFLWEPGWRPDGPDREAVAEECADVLIYLLQIADEMAIDLEVAVELKIQCNGHKYPAQKGLFA